MKFIVYEVEYPEDGSELIEADSPEQARGEWLRMTRTAEADAPELSVKPATPEHLDARLGFDLAESVSAVKSAATFFRAGEDIGGGALAKRCGDLVEACTAFLAAHKAASGA